MILVTGATGLNGQELVRRLSQRGVPVRALTRKRDSTAAARVTALPGVELVEGDLSRPETLAQVLQGVERAMLISPSTPDMLQDQTNFIEAARAARLVHVVKLSGIIPELDSPFRFGRMHGAIEKRLEASGVPFTHLRAGEFMQAYFRQANPIMARGILPLPMGEARIASIDVSDVAEVAAAVLTSDGHVGMTYHLTGPESLNMHEVAERLSAALGRPVRYEDIDPAAALEARLAAGMPRYLAEGLDELFAERRKGKEAKVWDTVESVFGLRPTPFAEFAARNAAAFKGEAPAR